MQNRFGGGIVWILQLFIKYTAELICGKQNLRMKSKEFRVLKYTYSMVVVACISSNKTRILHTENYRRKGIPGCFHDFETIPILTNIVGCLKMILITFVQSHSFKITYQQIIMVLPI